MTNPGVKHYGSRPAVSLTIVGDLQLQVFQESQQAVSL